MADRFPLILNTSTNQIQEIPSGDNLDLTGVGINNVGVITSGNVQIGAATTDLVVTGDARITGILTIGTSSLKLDGPNNLVNVGTALTLGHTQGLQFHTQNLHSAGFEVNQINVSGVATATTFKGDGDFVELDVDGHTNLDNVSIAGVTTMSGNLNVVNNSPFIDLTDNDHNSDYKFLNDNGTFKIQDMSNSNAVRYQLGADGKHYIYGDTAVMGSSNLTVGGNLSVGGVLTYEDVTNVDSIGIITARNGINVSSGTATFQGAIDANGDLDVDGHTNLDNVSIAGVVTATTFSGSGASLTGIANANVASNAAIAGTKISPNFGAQNILTTGQLQISGALPTILLNDENNENDFEIRNQNGSFIIRDIDNPQTRYTIASSGMIHTFHGAASFSSNLDVGAGIDVTGNSTFVNDIDVDGHTNLDNVSVAGVSTFAGNADFSAGIDVTGSATINGTTNAVNITHTGGHGLSISRSSKSFSINANWSAHDTHTAIEATSGMDIRFYLGGTEKIRLESAGNIVPTTDSQITLGNSSKRFTTLWTDYVEANRYGSLGQYAGKFGTIRIGADAYGNTIKTNGDNNLNITVPHSVYFNTGANSDGSDAGTARLRIYDSGIVPSNDKQIDLGSTSIAWRNVYTDNIVTTTALSNRNVIHNGTMFVAQRGTSQSGVNSSGYVRTADRWKLQANGSNVGTYTVSRSTDNPGEFGYSFKIQCTTAHSSLANNEMYEFVQLIEGRNVQRFNKGNSTAKPFALSFYVKTNKTGTYAVLLLDHQNGRMCCANYTVSNTGWNRYEIVFPADTTGTWSYTVSTRLSVKFVLLTGSDFTSGTLQTTWGSGVNANSRVGHNVNLADSVGNVFYITGVQLEAASACTPYEHKDYTHVLRECQRYLFTTPILGAGVWNGPNSFFTACHVPVPMRAHPTVSTNSGNFNTINIEHEDNYGVNSITNPSSGHANPNSTAAQQHSGFSSFIIGVSVTYTATTGYGGLVVCDSASDYFILDAQL